MKNCTSRLFPVPCVFGLGSRKFAATCFFHFLCASLGVGSRKFATSGFISRIIEFSGLVAAILRHTASTMVSLVPGLGSRKFATHGFFRLILVLHGLLATNSRADDSSTLKLELLLPSAVHLAENLSQVTHTQNRV